MLLSVRTGSCRSVGSGMSQSFTSAGESTEKSTNAKVGMLQEGGKSFKVVPARICVYFCAVQEKNCIRGDSKTGEIISKTRSNKKLNRSGKVDGHVVLGQNTKKAEYPEISSKCSNAPVGPGFLNFRFSWFCVGGERRRGGGRRKGRGRWGEGEER